MTLSTIKTCPRCAKSFQPKAREDQNYCSRKCRRAAGYKRARAKANHHSQLREPLCRPPVRESNPYDRALNATGNLIYALKRQAQALGCPEALVKAEAAMDAFEDAFNLVNEGLEIAETAINEREAKGLLIS